MLKIALKILIKNTSKYLIIILGFIFAVIIITVQGGIFLSAMKRAYNIISDTPGPDIWITDSHMTNIEDKIPLKFSDLEKIKSLKEIKWAVPFAKGTVKIILPDGSFQGSTIIGIDNASFIGRPAKIIEGNIKDLKNPDSIIVSSVGFDSPIKINDVLLINGKSTKIVGICEVSKRLLTHPIIYTTYDSISDCGKNTCIPMVFILAKAKKNVNIQKLCNKIQKQYNVKAYTTKQFKNFVIDHFIKHPAFGLNYGFAVLIGFIIGIAMVGKNFYDFVAENEQFFALFKAMGAENLLLIKMTLMQVLYIGFISWPIGSGIASLLGFLFEITYGYIDLSFRLPWYLFSFTILSTLAICIITSIFSLKKVMKIEPAIIFQP